MKGWFINMIKFTESGYVELNPNLNDSYDLETGEEVYVPSEYPFSIPKVYLDATSVTDYSSLVSSCFDDSIIEVTDEFLTRYTNKIYYEALVEDDNGNEIWVDGRTLHSENSWDEASYKNARIAMGYEIERIDLNSLEKTKYKVTLESTSQMDMDDYSKFVNYIDSNLIKKININKDTNPI